MNKKKINGYVITLKEWDNIIEVEKDGVIINESQFSDAIKARIAYDNLK